MAAPKPYEVSDKAIKQLNKKAVKKLSATKSSLLSENFDELNVLQKIDTLYYELDQDNRKKFKELFIAQYVYCLRYLKKKRPDEDILDEMADMYLLDMLSKPDPVTHYTYDTEVYRKRDRCKEAVNSVNGKLNKQLEMDKALKYWAQMTAQYADNVNDTATIKAFVDAGFQKVQWHTEEDDRVCSECDPLDEKVFDIDEVPDKPHWGCRCWITPVGKSVAKSDDGGIINKKQPKELYRKNTDNYQRRDRHGFISKERLDRLTIGIRKRGAIILQGDAVDARLDDMNVDASTLYDVIFFRKEVTLLEALEEIRHVEQNLDGLFSQQPNEERTLLCEIEARDYILANAKSNGISRLDIETLKDELEVLQRDLQQYLERNG